MHAKSNQVEETMATSCGDITTAAVDQEHAAFGRSAIQEVCPRPCPFG
jgi:hypothetical protein